MQQYNVPQFAEVEDKIFGPLTLRQFLAILAGAVVIFIIYAIFNFSLFFWFLSLPVAAVTLFVALANIAGRSVLSHFFPFLAYFITPKRRVFHREEPELIIRKKTQEQKNSEAMQPREVQSRLKRLAYVLDEKATAEQEALSGLRQRGAYRSASREVGNEDPGRQTTNDTRGAAE